MLEIKGSTHLGATWTWADGNARENGPTNSLCSTAKVGSTICSTGRPSSFTNATHSLHAAKENHYKYTLLLPIERQGASADKLSRLLISYPLQG